MNFFWKKKIPKKKLKKKVADKTRYSLTEQRRTDSSLNRNFAGPSLKMATSLFDLCLRFVICHLDVNVPIGSLPRAILMRYAGALREFLPVTSRPSRMYREVLTCSQSIRARYSATLPCRYSLTEPSYPALWSASCLKCGVCNRLTFRLVHLFWQPPFCFPLLSLNKLLNHWPWWEKFHTSSVVHSFIICL